MVLYYVGRDMDAASTRRESLSSTGGGSTEEIPEISLLKVLTLKGNTSLFRGERGRQA